MWEEERCQPRFSTFSNAFPSCGVLWDRSLRSDEAGDFAARSVDRRGGTTYNQRNLEPIHVPVHRPASGAITYGLPISYQQPREQLKLRCESPVTSHDPQAGDSGCPHSSLCTHWIAYFLPSGCRFCFYFYHLVRSVEFSSFA